MRPSKKNAHLIVAFIFLITLITTSSEIYVLPVVSIIALAAYLSVGRLAAALVIFIPLIAFPLLRLGGIIFLEEFFFIMLGGLSFAIAGSNRIIYQLDNFAQGAILFAWLALIMKVMHIMSAYPNFEEFIGLRHITHNLGDEANEGLSSIVFGYAIYGLCQLIIKWRERQDLDSSDNNYLGK